MDELLSYVVKNLVNHPDDVLIDEQSSGGQVNLILTVNPEDMGLIIGKGGQTIKAIRKLLITKAIVDNVRVNLQLAEPEGNVRPEKSDKNLESGVEGEQETEPTDSTEQAPLNDEEETPTEAADNTKTPTEADSAETPAVE